MLVKRRNNNFIVREGPFDNSILLHPVAFGDMVGRRDGEKENFLFAYLIAETPHGITVDEYNNMDRIPQGARKALRKRIWGV